MSESYNNLVTVVYKLWNKSLQVRSAHLFIPWAFPDHMKLQDSNVFLEAM